jgi:isoleucyl-tRNA synthetase
MAFVTDSSGYKMSKSEGNVIDPSEVINKAGAEILRLWGGPMKIMAKTSMWEMKSFNESLKPTVVFEIPFALCWEIWMTLIVIRDGIPFEKMPELDQWALVRLNDLIKRVQSAYEKL